MSDSIPTSPKAIERGLPGLTTWCWWIFASLIGSVVGLPLLLALPARDSIPGGPLRTLLPALGFGVMFLPISVGQWFVLRRYMHHASRWVAANVVGLIGLAAVTGIAYAIGDEDTELVMVLLEVGITLGAAQWFVLRPHLEYASLWIAVSGVSWILAIFLSGEVFNAFFGNTLREASLSTADHIHMVALWTTYELMTGGVLILLWMNSDT